MRNQKEMLSVILQRAKKDSHIRGVLLQGSRVSKEASPDCFQDYDVVFLADTLEPFLENPRWIDCFGHRIIMQIPEKPTESRITYLMQFTDGNRIDLTLVRLDKKDTDPRVRGMVLLDKDELFPHPLKWRILFWFRGRPEKSLTNAAMNFYGPAFMWQRDCGGMKFFMPSGT